MPSMRTMSHITGSDSGDAIIRCHHILIFPLSFSYHNREENTQRTPHRYLFEDSEMQFFPLAGGLLGEIGR